MKVGTEQAIVRPKNQMRICSELDMTQSGPRQVMGRTGEKPLLLQPLISGPVLFSAIQHVMVIKQLL